MALSRNVTIILHYALDQLLPPALRESRLFMAPLFYLALGKKAAYYLDFKDRLLYLSDSEINGYYSILADTFLRRETNLNQACIDFIDEHVVGERILDAACGKGFMVERLSMQGKQVTGVDINLPESKLGSSDYLIGEIVDLPFADQSFDTVICTHALEHIRNIQRAVEELKRVCRKRLIVVVPCQREYRYTFDLHIHFFPYEYKLRDVFGAAGEVLKLSGDLVYCVDLD